MISLLKRIISRRNAPEHLKTGEWGEKVAAKLLRSAGYKILGQRVRFGSKYELDIVARNSDTLIFVEVKTRKNEDFGRPVSAVNRHKRETITKAALKYLKKTRKLPDYIRFDVIEVIGSSTAGDPEIRHLENVFTLDKRYRLPFKFRER